MMYDTNKLYLIAFDERMGGYPLAYGLATVTSQTDSIVSVYVSDYYYHENEHNAARHIDLDRKHFQGDIPHVELLDYTSEMLAELEEAYML